MVSGKTPMNARLDNQRATESEITYSQELFLSTFTYRIGRGFTAVLPIARAVPLSCPNKMWSPLNNLPSISSHTQNRWCLPLGSFHLDCSSIFKLSRSLQTGWVMDGPSVHPANKLTVATETKILVPTACKITTRRDPIEPSGAEFETVEFRTTKVPFFVEELIIEGLYRPLLSHKPP